MAPLGLTNLSVAVTDGHPASSRGPGNGFVYCAQNGLLAGAGTPGAREIRSRDKLVWFPDGSYLYIVRECPDRPRNCEIAATAVVRGVIRERPKGLLGDGLCFCETRMVCCELRWMYGIGLSGFQTDGPGRLGRFILYVMGFGKTHLADC